MASQMTISGQDLNERPITRPGEILEAVPGLAVVAHADGGKANQYYLRGYNLDHGTDLAIFVDDMPINLPTHAHGQGYADLNWLMPETVNGLDVRKGPYFADVGDFATAGSLFINLKDSVDKNIVPATAGSFGDPRPRRAGGRPSPSGPIRRRPGSAVDRREEDILGRRSRPKWRRGCRAGRGSDGRRSMMSRWTGRFRRSAAFSTNARRALREDLLAGDTISIMATTRSPLRCRTEIEFCLRR